MKQQILIRDLPYKAKFAFPNHPDIVFVKHDFDDYNDYVMVTFADDFDSKFPLYVHNFTTVNWL